MIQTCIIGDLQMNIQRSRGGARRRLNKPAKTAFNLLQLENRWCPTITAVLAGGTLTITGNGGSDHVIVTQEDDGDLRVLGNNGNLATVFDGNSVTTLKANLGAGFNNLDIDLTVSNGGDFDHEGFDQNPIIMVTAGNDSDTVTINLGDDAGGGGGGGGDDDGRGDVLITASLTGGNDRVTIIAGGDFGGEFNLSMKMGSGNDSIDVALDGDIDGNSIIDSELGTGNDTYTFEVSGDVKSDFEFDVISDSGNDRITTEIVGSISGNAPVAADLGPGNDTFTMDVGGAVGSIHEFALLGGTGNDQAALSIGGNVDGDALIAINMGSSNDSFDLEVDGDTSGIFEVDLLGESGNDTISFDIGGDVSGPMTLLADLGSGNDRFEVSIDGNIVDDEVVSMQFNGGVGLDTVIYTFAEDELNDIDFTSIFFENETYNEIGMGVAGAAPWAGLPQGYAVDLA